jgi:hypothetical protein
MSTSIPNQGRGAKRASGARRGSKTPRTRVAGEVVVAGELYSLDALKVRTKLGTAALRQARRSGLRVIRIGSRTFVDGGDFISWAKSQAAASDSPPAGDDARRAG